MTAAELIPPPPTRPPLRVNWLHLLMWVGLMLLALLFLRAVQPILMPFVLGIAVAYLMDPLADRLGRWHIGRNVAAAILTLGLFALLSALVVWLGPLLYHQLVELLQKVPGLLQQLEGALRHDAAPLLKTLKSISGTSSSADTLPSSVGDVLQRTLATMTDVLTNVLASAATLLNMLALVLITPIVCFYLIRDWPGFLARTSDLLPRVYAPIIREQLQLINKTLAAYLRGQLTVVGILIIYYAIFFVIFGVNYSLLLALLAGILVVIPYIGTLISVSFGLVIAYGQFGADSYWWGMVTVYAVGNILESQILTPKIIGDRVGLHPLWMLFGMLCGAVLFGFVGVLLAVPLTAAISVLVKFAIARYLDSTLYTQA